jgi:hypothetical protein
MSFKPEVIADSSGKWTPNGMAFATREEAEVWVKDLANRWFMVTDTRVVESDQPVNYRLKRMDAQTHMLEDVK